MSRSDLSFRRPGLPPMRLRLPQRLVLSALLALTASGCVNNLVEGNGPYGRYDAITPATYPTVSRVEIPPGTRILSPAQQAQEAAILRAKGAANNAAARNVASTTSKSGSTAATLKAKSAANAAAARCATGYGATPPPGCKP